MLKAVAPVLLALATVATPAAATTPGLTDVVSCRTVAVTLPNGDVHYIEAC